MDLLAVFSVWATGLDQIAEVEFWGWWWASKWRATRQSDVYVAQGSSARPETRQNPLKPAMRAYWRVMGCLYARWPTDWPAGARPRSATPLLPDMNPSHRSVCCSAPRSRRLLFWTRLPDCFILFMRVDTASRASARNTESTQCTHNRDS